MPYPDPTEDDELAAMDWYRMGGLFPELTAPSNPASYQAHPGLPISNLPTRHPDTGFQSHQNIIPWPQPTDSPFIAHGINQNSYSRAAGWPDSGTLSNNFSSDPIYMYVYDSPPAPMHSRIVLRLTSQTWDSEALPLRGIKVPIARLRCLLSDSSHRDFTSLERCLTQSLSCRPRQFRNTAHMTTTLLPAPG